MKQITSSIEAITARAKLLANIREFFNARHIIEVETPLLYPAANPDPSIHSITAELNNKKYYLQTSPEFAMKRLLAFGIGSCYQLCKAFRAEESGRFHNSEFSILEWYHLGFDHHQLMDEMDQFLMSILQTQAAKRITYQALFLEYLHIDPLTASIPKLQQCAAENNINVHNAQHVIDRNDWLHLLMDHCIEEKITFEAPLFIYNYPVSQAALAKINAADPRTAERFEVYVNGIELANGFHELTNAHEQRTRFQQENKSRKNLGLPEIPLDEAFLTALASLPPCAGVALGIDRLLMLLINSHQINDVISFPL